MGDLEFYSKIDFLELWYSHECSSTFELLPLVNTAQNYAAVFSFNQTQGKGQNNNVWHSKPYMNLAFSAWLPIPNWATHNLVLYNMCLAIQMHAALENLSQITLKIKWPNDIYYGNKKLAGMLMSVQSVADKKFLQLGIGINGNELNFPNTIPNPISIAQITKNTINLNLLAERIAQACTHAFQKVDIDILSAFNSILYLKSQSIEFEFKGEKNVGVLVDVNEFGQLGIQQFDKTVYYHQGEIKMLIK